MTMKGKMHGKKAGGGSVEEGRDLEKEDKTPSVVYAGKDSDVVKEASKRKKGGVCKKRGGAVDGEKGEKRLDKMPRRATGGRVGAETRPLSEASKISERPGAKQGPELD
jgi:hypothetical protein